MCFWIYRSIYGFKVFFNVRIVWYYSYIKDIYYKVKWYFVGYILFVFDYFFIFVFIGKGMILCCMDYIFDVNFYIYKNGKYYIIVFRIVYIMELLFGVIWIVFI